MARKITQSPLEGHKDIECYFLQKAEIAHWMKIVRERYAPWVKRHKNKGYWDYPRFLSIRMGVLKENVGRPAFAKILLTLFPDLFDEKETPKHLKGMMDNAGASLSDLKNYDQLKDSHPLKLKINELEELNNCKDEAEAPKLEKSTLTDILGAYLRKSFPDLETYPRQRLVVNPVYDDLRPAFAIELYLNEGFWNANRPSTLMAFELVDEKLTVEMTYGLIGRYSDLSSKSGFKLLVVSSQTIPPDVQRLCASKQIALAVLNPNAEMTDDSFFLWHSVGDRERYLSDMESFTGKKPMKSVMLMCYDGKFSSSLAEYLMDAGITVYGHRKMRVPFLKNEDIERIAAKFTKEHIEKWLHSPLMSIGVMKDLLAAGQEIVYDLSFDPFQAAREMGINIEYVDFRDAWQLGRMDFKTNTISLSRNLDGDYLRSRFNMSHEFGHAVIHRQLFEEFGLESIGDIDGTVFGTFEETVPVDRNDQKWLEHHANHFASCLLLPKELVECVFRRLFEIYPHAKYGDRFGSIYYSPNQPETWWTYNNVAVRMARWFNVSKKVMDRRLIVLGRLKLG